MKAFFSDKKYLFGATLLLLVFNIIVWGIVTSSRAEELEISFLNVGQGDAIFITTPNGNQILIDGGPDSSVLRELGKVMPFYDRSIDVVLATHSDADHIGGLPLVFKRFEIDAYIDNGAGGTTATFDALTESVRLEESNVISAFSGERVWLDEEVYLDIFYPNEGEIRNESNENSIVAKLVYRNFSVMLTGDSPIAIEKYLSAKYSNNLEANVLKIGHHGSKTSTSLYFLNSVKPELAIISAGKNNKYGHPHESVLSLLKDRSIEIKNTTSSGRIIIKSDGAGYVIE